MYLQYECKEPVSIYPALKWWNQPKIGAEWMFNGTGIGASNAEWGIDHSLTQRGGVMKPEPPAALRQIWLLQRRSGKPGAG
ncbi:hypothetical protein HZD82_26040, partial [Pantoea agglomerans]|uniref:hypothetical protein n=1 Tax=Enterobacter agglomerans TaxID=549 RepID=UPI001A8C563E